MLSVKKRHMIIRNSLKNNLLSLRNLTALYQLHARFWWESPKERDHLEDQGVGGKMGSEWILGILAWGCGLNSTGSGQGPVAGCCECGDELSVFFATELVS
jgi:hypothetical protein